MSSGQVNVIPIQFDENKNPYFVKIDPNERPLYGGTPIGKLSIHGKFVCLYRHTIIYLGQEKPNKRFLVGIATKNVPTLMIQKADIKPLDKSEVVKMVEELKHFYL